MISGDIHLVFSKMGYLGTYLQECGGGRRLILTVCLAPCRNIGRHPTFHHSEK